MSRLPIAAIALLVLMACGTVRPTAGSIQEPIPWLPLPAKLDVPPQPSPEPYPVPAGTPACRASDLIAVVVGAQGATGHIETSITFSGSGSTPCFLDGTPAVTLLDARGRDLAFGQHAPYMPDELTGPEVVEPGPPHDPHTALKIGQASLTIDWESQPEACEGEAPSTIAGARLAIPAGGTITVQISGEPAGYACQGVGVGNFEGPPMVADTSASPTMPHVALQAPASATPGKQYRYTITLANSSAKPIDLPANCPNYFEALIEPGSGLSVTGKQIYLLNCAPAGILAPGRSATFEIKLDVPSSAASGSYTLVFTLGYSNAFGKPDAPPVEVTLV